MPTYRSPWCGDARGEARGGTSLDAMDPVPLDRFEQLVGEALDDVPAGLAQFMDNVIVVVEDEHPDEPDILGLYEGIPLTERDDYGGFAMPDRVSIFRLPLCSMCADEPELVDQVTITVIHELAHHFGIDDDTLHELGWG